MCNKPKAKVARCKRIARSATPSKLPDLNVQSPPRKGRAIKKQCMPLKRRANKKRGTPLKRQVAKGSKSKKSSGTKQIETFRKFVRGHTPLPRDLRRQLRDDELSELCKRVPCRVDMSRWNRVYDYQRHFEREGRLKHKNQDQVNKLLAKAVNRYKDEVYTEEEIQEARCHEWAERKKDHLMRLRLWKYDRKHEREHEHDDDNDDDCD